MYTNTRMTRDMFKHATLANATPVVFSMDEAPLPATVTLKSSDAGRKIEASTDGGVEYFTPAVDVTSATMQVVIFMASVSHIRVTGGAGGTDTWSVR